MLATLPVQAADLPALDQIIVTGQIIDVSASTSTVDGTQLEKNDIHNAQGLVDYLPGLTITQAALGSLISIRGMTSDVNQGFEQSAPVFVDGVRFGRAKLTRAPFLDIAQIDLLRGPQSILLGKNTTAGALNIITAKPTSTFEGNLTALYEPEYGEREAQLVLSGPISETVSGRMAVMDRTDNGFIENTTLNRTESANKDQVIRTSFEWKLTPTWNLNLKFEEGKFDSDGRNVEVVKSVSLHPNDPNPYATLLSYLTAGSYHLDIARDDARQSNGDFSYNKTHNITLTAEHNSDAINLRVKSGYVDYNSTDLCDCDFTGSAFININSVEKYQQHSHEIIIASQDNKTLNWLFGGLYMSTALNSHYEAHVPPDSAIAGNAISPLLAGASSQRDFVQESDLYSIFAQTTWSITETTRAVFGGRYTQETKTADRHAYHITPTGETLPEGKIYDPYNQLWSLFKIEPHRVSSERTENDFTPKVSLQHDINTSDQLYASYTTGIKSGGFDAISNSVPAALGGIYPNIEGSWEFNAEKITSYEVGGKFLFAQNSAALNISLFYARLHDIQNNQYDQGIGYNVNNVGTAVIHGAELNSHWIITPSWAVRGNFAMLDFKYTNLPNAQCYFGETDQTQPFGDGTCGATGKAREYTPKVQTNIGGDYKIELFNRLTLTNTIDVIYSSSYLTTNTLDPRMMQSAFTKINARIALSPQNNMWEIALIGKNLTGKKIITYASDLPLASTLTQGQGSGYYAFYDNPRSISLQAKIKF